MHLPHKFTSIAYICKNMQQKNAYEKYVSMKFICIIIVRIVGLQCDVTRHNSWVAVGTWTWDSESLRRPQWSGILYQLAMAAAESILTCPDLQPESPAAPAPGRPTLPTQSNFNSPGGRGRRRPGGESSWIDWQLETWMRPRQRQARSLSRGGGQTLANSSAHYRRRFAAAFYYHDCLGTESQVTPQGHHR